jgi:CBS domain-containing protein
LVKVGEVTTTRVPRIEASASVLDASKVMNQGHRRWTGVVVTQAGKPVGMLTERSILRRFIGLNRKPEDVKVREVMAPLLKISSDAPVSDAVRKLLDYGFTRLGVYDNDKLVGWVTLTDIARRSSKQSIVNVLLRQNRPASDDEVLCPQCRSAIMKKVIQGQGKILRWECPKCGYEV